MAKANTFETGTDGTVMTTGNTTAGGDAASVIVSNNVATSGALTYEADAAHYGSMGMRITFAAGTSYWRWDDTLATGRWVLRRTFLAQTVTSGLIVLGGLYNGGILMDQIKQSSTGVLRAADAAGDISASDSPALTMDSEYLLELAVTEGASTSTGRVEFAVWDLTDASLFHTYDSGATKNTGTVGVTRCRVGGGVTGQGWTVDDAGEIRFAQLASGWWGPLRKPAWQDRTAIRRAANY